MSVTIKSFLKDKINNSYTLNELKELSDEYSQLNSSDSKKSLILLCKYVKVVDSKITFDITNRYFDQTYDKIEQLVQPIKKKGFGIFRKKDIEQINKDEEHIIKEPIVKKKVFVLKGTDDYHDKIVKSDILNKDELRRVDIYRDLATRKYFVQRSPEWFAQRDTLISASDGGTVVNLNPYEASYSFILKKVFGKPFETSEACYHGKKFEQIATMIYEYKMNVSVKEFGLCSHSKYNFLGASPDGIVSEYKLNDNTCKTKFVGRMLEIKCPMMRDILMDEEAVEVYGTHGETITDLKKDVKKGVCPAYYWVQVQLQLQCCNLDECDFWQCKLEEYEDRESYLKDTNSSKEWLTSNGFEKGVLIQLMPIAQLHNKTMPYNNLVWNYAEFIYPPLIAMSNLELDKWLLETIHNLKTTHKEYVIEKITYWKLTEYRNHTVKKDEEWFRRNLPVFEETWKYVLFFRENKEKAMLMKKYIYSFPKDRWGNIIEEPKGIIMETIKKIYEGKKIKNIEKIKDIEEKIYNVNDDIEYIINYLKKSDTSDDKLSILIKKLKFEIDNYNSS